MKPKTQTIAGVARLKKRAHSKRIAKVLSTIPDTFVMQLLEITVLCRYFESLLARARVRRHLDKYRPHILEKLDRMLAEFNDPQIKPRPERKGKHYKPRS